MINDIAIVCYKDKNVNPWDPDTIKNGIAGSEEAVINVTDLLIKKGNKVTVYGNPPKTSKYSHYVDIDLLGNIKHQVIIAWRRTDFSYLAQYANKVYFWPHDIPFNEIKSEELKYLAGCFFLSKYQKLRYIEQNILINTIQYVICGNGINPSHFSNPLKQERKPYSCAYISNYARGLTLLLDIWPTIKSKFPKATLDIYYGRNTFGLLNDEGLNKIIKQIENLKDKGVREVGKVGHVELAEALKKTSILSYPCITNDETYCISAVKAQAAGCIPVCTRNGALNETIHPDAPTIDNIKTQEDLIKYTDLLIKTMETIKEHDRKKYIKYASTQTWEECVNKMLSLINHNILNKQIQLVMIVKNGSKPIAKTLKSYFGIVDEFTILDTGSTDGTQDIIRETLKGKKYKLVEEKFTVPFHFDEGRNRALELGNPNTYYTIMPDDSYAINGNNIREQILSNNNDYYCVPVNGRKSEDAISDGSQKRNIIWKTEYGFKYKYPIHEFIDFPEWMSTCVLNAFVDDVYDRERSDKRLNDDYFLLSEYLKKDRKSSRMWYYMGQTAGLLNKWEEAFDAYKNYLDCNPTFQEEKFGALYKRALVAEFNLKKPWHEVLALYTEAFDFIPFRAEPLFSIAEYYINTNPSIGYMYINRAKDLELNPVKFNSFDPHMYGYYIPRLYAKYCIALKIDQGLEYAKKAYRTALELKRDDWLKDMESIINILVKI